MAKYDEIEAKLRARLTDLLERAEVIEEDLRHPLETDLEEQAIDLADDEALKGVDDILRHEIRAVRAALARIADGSYGSCIECGKQISEGRLAARPIAVRCIDCAGEV